MDLARIGGLDDEAGLHARALAHQVLLHRRQRQRCRDRGVLGVDAPVAEDQDVAAVVDRELGGAAQLGDRGGEALGPFGDRPQQAQRDRFEHALGQRADLRELGVIDHRAAQPDLVALLGRLLEGVAVGTHRGLDRHHRLLADRIDRRVGDLRELLVEVRRQVGRAIRQTRERRVVPHRTDRLLAVDRHRQHDQLDVLVGVTVCALQPRQPVTRHALRRRYRIALREVEHVLGQPSLVGEPARDIALELVVVDDPALLGIDHEHHPGLQAALRLDALGWHVDHAGLRRQDHLALGGDRPSRGPEAIAIERGPDQLPVGEHDRRGTVPRLDQLGRVAIERLAILVDQVPLGLGDHHHHRVR